MIREFDSPHFFKPILKQRKKPNLQELCDPSDNASHADIFKSEMKMKWYYKEKSEYNNSLFGLWALINGQGSTLAKTGTKAVKGYTKV